MPDFRRKRNRLPRYAYLGRRAYFVTICTRQRRPLLNHARLVDRLLGALREKCAAHAFDVYAYCFMPDHLHLELIALADTCRLDTFLHAFKGAGASEAREMGVRGLWQKGFYDHVIRTSEGLGAVAWYIFSNPHRKNLVERIDQWPYSGSFQFDWKKLVAPPKAFEPPWKKPGSSGG